MSGQPHETPPPVAAPANLGHQAVVGVFWVGAGQFVRMGVSFLTTILLTRLLQPSEVGVFGLAYVVAELAQILTGFGIGSAIVQQQVTHARTLQACFWLNLLIGVGVALALVASAPLVASFYTEPAITGLIAALAVNVLLCSAMVVPQALLTQRMAFAAQAKAQVLGSLCSAVAAVTAALLGAGVWTLALQPLVGNAITLLVMMHDAGWRPRLQGAWADVRPLIRFSSHMLVGGWLDWLSRSLPSLFIGKWLGTAAVGIYGTASGLTGTVVFQITSVITRVLFPTLSQLKDDPPRLQAAWLKATSGIAMLTWPLLGCAAVLGTDLIPLVYGAQWTDAGVPFQALAVMMMVQSVAFAASAVLIGLGRPDVSNLQTMLGIALSAVALGVGAAQGLVEATVLYAASRIALLAWTFHAAVGMAGLGWPRLLAEVRPWAQATVLAAMATHGAQMLLANSTVGWRVALALTAGGVAYPAALWVFSRERSTALFQDVWGRLRKR